jgi:hypothetical protein
MELIGSLFLVLAVALVVVIFVMQPFVKRQELPAAAEQKAAHQQDHQRSALLAERDRVLTALQELDFDNAMGKVPAEDYTEQRAALLHRGADVMRRLDSNSANPGSADAMEARIEATIASRRADSATAEAAVAVAAAGGAASAAGAATAGAATAVVVSNGGNARDELESLIASRKRQRKESAAGFCPRCGRPVQKSDKFCSRCGATQ